MRLIEKIPYSQAVGSIMYSIISTRPNLSFAISVRSRFMRNPEQEHWMAMKWLLGYLKVYLNMGLVYEKNVKPIWLEGFMDSDYGGDRDKRSLTTSYFFTLNGCCISWKSQLQSIVALFAIEAKYIAATESIKEAIWLQGLLTELK